MGSVQDWPEELLAAIRTVLDSELPVLLFWGPDLIQIYNDACLPNLSDRHPRAIAQPARECWSDVWETLAPAVGEIMQGRERGKRFDQQLLFLQRNGHLEETFWTFSYSGITDRNGTVRGIFVQTNDAVTAQVVGARRLRTLRELGQVPAIVSGSAVEASRAIVDVLTRNRSDAPFGTIYLLDTDARPELVAWFGYRAGSSLPPGPDTDPVAMGRVRTVAATGEPMMITGMHQQFPGFFDQFGILGDAEPDSALMLPLNEHGQSRRLGVLVLGISPYRSFDSDYRAFFHLVSDQISISVTDARAYEAERRRAAELTDLDAAKTRFFQNISHELRTPLTLLLGPLQQVLDNGELNLPERHRQDLKAARRAALRLQRLVDGLLEVARGEADRSHPAFEPTDLGTLTSDCVSMFRSAIESAGLSLTLDVPDSAPLVPVDRQMWAHIVLNLLSNAMKFTLGGGIGIRLTIGRRFATLLVTDSGIGIPSGELPLIFERFHQVQGQAGRTREGAGIGLSLVADLVRAHGGEVRVRSTLGDGSTFTVKIPAYHTHRNSPGVPAQQGARDHVDVRARMLEPPAEIVAMYLADAAQWTMSATPAVPAAEQSAAPSPGSILIVEDNADLRDYLTRLLGGDGWKVTPLVDTESALRHQQEPDLVLADVMLPNRDGLDLLRTLRAAPGSAHIPVVLLTARAGPEFVSEGLSTGADDYVVKPFEAIELLARVRATVELNRRRRLPLDLALDRAANLQVALSTNRRIGTAIGILMAERKVRSERAFELLSNSSQALHRKLADVADDVILTGVLPSGRV